MPTITNTRNNGSIIVSELVDSVGSTARTYTFPDTNTRDTLEVFNIGDNNLVVSVGTQTNVTILAYQSQKFDQSFTSFTLNSSSGHASFRARASYKGEDEEDEQRLSAQLAENVTLTRPEINIFEGYANKMKNGLSVTIDCWGDSTYWGHASGVDPLGTQVSTPPPVALQSILRSYYNNNLITVINNGTKGWSTDFVISTWDAKMTASTGNIIFINYGINDGKDGMSPEHYRDNLINMVLIARQHNKDVVFDTPNIVLSTDSANDGMGNLSRSQTIKHFAEIMRRVAKELNVPLVDNYERTSNYLSDKPNIQTSIPDGMHPSDDMYYFKAVQMAELFVQPKSVLINKEAIIPCMDSRINYYGNTSAFALVPASKSGALLLANNIRVAINLTKPMDLILGTTFWTSGPNSVTVKVDGKTIQTLNLKDPLITDWGIDLEVLMTENVSSGFHIIEIDSSVIDANNRVGLFYIRTKEIKNKQSTVPIGDTYKKITRILDGVEYTATASESKVLTDIETSNVIRPIDVEVTAKLSDMSGFFVLGSKRNTSGNVLGGVTVYMKSGTLYLAESTATTYASQVVLIATDYTTSQHVFRLIVSTSGVVQVFVDGVQVGSNYTMQTIVKGGYLGFYRQTAGTVTIDKVRIRE